MINNNGIARASAAERLSSTIEVARRYESVLAPVLILVTIGISTGVVFTCILKLPSAILIRSWFSNLPCIVVSISSAVINMLALLIVIGIFCVVRADEIRKCVWKRRRANGFNICIDCGYDLRGAPRQICPECGKSFPQIVNIPEHESHKPVKLQGRLMDYPYIRTSLKLLLFYLSALIVLPFVLVNPDVVAFAMILGIILNFIILLHLQYLIEKRVE